MSDDGRNVTDPNASIEPLTAQTIERDHVWRNSLDILVVTDADGVFQAISPAWKRVLGHDASDVIGHSFRDFVIDDNVGSAAQAISPAARGIDANGFENRYRHKDGSERVLAWRTSAEDGAFYGYARDVTIERAHARKLARCAAERERLWRTNPMLFARAAYDSTILEVNPAWTAMLGWTQKELVGKSYAEYVHADDAERSLEWARRKASGQNVEELQNRYRCKDGGTRWIAWAITADDDVFHCVGRDVTEQRAQAEAVEALEAHLRQSQKMEAVGQLTGGIAHDFNNMLTGVIAGLDIIQRRLAEQRYDDIDRFVAAAGQSADRAADLVKRLMAFSRQHPLTIETIDVNMLTGRIEGMLRQALGTGIDLMTDLSPDLGMVEADPGQLENALLNLAINARDAMPDGGELKIATRNLAIEDGVGTRPAGLVAGSYVAISVSDTGLGMSQTVINRAFDPFFTTKPIGQGTGLGLSMIYGFAKQSRGHVEIVSDVGQGTTITLYLPRAINPALEVTQGPIVLNRRALAGQTILIVDDEPAVRLMIGEVVSELGYTFVEAGDAEAALTILRTDLVIDLLVTDVGMPGMNGWQLSQLACRLRPKLNVLFVTGYEGEVALNTRSEGKSVHVVTKPFALDYLGSKILSLTVEDKGKVPA